MWQLAANEKQGVLFATPKSDDDRQGIASACVRKLNIKIPALLDKLDDATEKAYTAWPDRLYLIGQDGRVMHKSDAGPFGFKPDGLEAALKGLPAR